MSTLVCFEVADAAYAVDVGAARGVQEASGIVPLPSPRAGVVGLLDPAGTALPVVRVGAGTGAGGGRHVLVLESAGERFGLLVDRVTGVVRVEDGAVHAPPAGQEDPIVRGIVRSPTVQALLVDPGILAGRLHGARS